MDRARRARIVALGVLLLAGAVVTYANHFDNSFHFDDSHVVMENTYIRDLGNIPRFFTDAETQSTLPTNRAYRPVLMTTLALDYRLAGGLEPFAFHLSTFFWFLVQGILMAFLFVRILALARPHRWNAFVAVLAVGWYVLHPANAETINYVSARSDSLSTLCVVAAFVVELYARSWRRHLGWALVIVGIFIKPTAVMFVPLLLLYRLLFVENLSLPDLLEPHGRAAAWRQVRGLLPGAILVGLAFWLTMVLTPETWVPGGESRLRYLITQPYVMLRYFALFFVPIRLSADTDWTALTTALDARFFAGTAFVIAGLATAWFTSRWTSLRPVSFGILWFFIALLPSSSLIPLAEVTNDHRMFFPFVGLTLALASGVGLCAIRYEREIAGTPLRRAGAAALLVLTLGSYAYGTYGRNQVWDTEESLWYDVTIKSPRNGRGLMNYGLARMARGDYPTAVRYFESALDTEYGGHAYLYVNLAIAEGALGRRDEAERYYAEALQRGPNDPSVHFFYARWLDQTGRTEEALQELALALRQSPGYEAALALRNEILATEGEGRTGGEPSADGFVELSLRLYQGGRYEESIEAAQRALTLKPDHAAAYNNICASSNSLGRWDDAIAACEKALELVPDFDLARNNLIWALQKRQEAGLPQ